LNNNPGGQRGREEMMMMMMMKSFQTWAEMDPGAALVTAYPLPPDYFREFDGESIRNIHPPSPPTVDCSVFGHYILVCSFFQQ
jgi:hypothetical protein